MGNGSPGLENWRAPKSSVTQPKTYLKKGFDTLRFRVCVPERRALCSEESPANGRIIWNTEADIGF